MTITIDDNVYYPLMAASGGLVAGGFVLWALLRRVHPLVLAGALLAVTGLTLFSFAMYAHRPWPPAPEKGTSLIPAVQVDDYKHRLAEWEGRPAYEREYLRPAWPAFLLVAVGGLVLMVYVWVCFYHKIGDFAPRDGPAA